MSYKLDSCPFFKLKYHNFFVPKTTNIMKQVQPNNQLDEMITASDVKDLMLNIGMAMRKLRLQKGYRCAEYFAYEYQLNRSAYYGWESGKNISVKKLILVCEALDVTLLEFFNLVKIPNRTKRTSSMLMDELQKV
jgi:hypothetical protein